jgi:hypothetical protein
MHYTNDPPFPKRTRHRIRQPQLLETPSIDKVFWYIKFILFLFNNAEWFTLAISVFKDMFHRRSELTFDSNGLSGTLWPHVLWDVELSFEGFVTVPLLIFIK